MITKHLSYAIISSVPMLLLYTLGIALSLLRLSKNRVRFGFSAAGFALFLISSLITLSANFVFNRDGVSGAHSGTYSAIPELIFLATTIARFIGFVCLLLALFSSTSTARHTNDA